MTAALPGVTLQVVPLPEPVTPLRSDIAGFIGGTRRGPVGRAVRVVGDTDLQRVFGGLDPAVETGYALRGYFENGGQVAWVVRVGGAGKTAGAPWAVGGLAGFPYPGYLLTATSPGSWANGMTVRIRYRSTSLLGPPEVDVRVDAVGEAVETLTGVPPSALGDAFQALRLVRLDADPAAAPPPPAGTPRSAEWTITLGGGTDAAATVDDYLRAARELADQPEVAIVAAPELAAHLDPSQRAEVITALLDDASEQLDRMVVLDVPSDRGGAPDAVAFADELRRGREPGRLREAALYHPRLRVPDPLGSTAAPARTLAASGHVAGVISRLDRERGAHHSPANAVVADAVDLDPQFTANEQVALFTAGINLLRCQPGLGLRVWGARTLDPSPAGRFLAHRRLVHRLVRAFQAVALPLVFDINGPELRLTLVRALTTVLLEAFRSGALAGGSPAEAFRVTCDETNNPPGQDPGLVVCDAEVAPAVPMEFIRLRLSLGQEGRLEVVEA